MAVYGVGLYGAGLYGGLIRLSYSPIREEVFISRGNNTTYILSKQGLSAISGQIEDLSYFIGVQLVHSSAAIVQDNITFSTDIINFNTQGLKALEWLQLNVDCPDDIFVTVRYRDSVKDAFVSAPRKQFNIEGVCHIGVRGVAFILDFDIPSYTALQLDSLDIGVQFIDRRFRRGIRAEGVR